MNEENSKTTPALNAHATAIIAYIGIIGLIISYCLGDRKDPFAIRHLNQSLVLSIASLGLFTLGITGFFYLPWIVHIALNLCHTLIFAMTVIGIITAIQKQKAGLPVISNIEILK